MIPTEVSQEVETLRDAVDAAGGPAAAADGCGISPRGIYKWLERGRFPRTEYTGETHYASKLAAMAAERGRPFDAAALLEKLRRAA